MQPKTTVPGVGPPTVNWPSPTSNINQENVLPPHLQPSLMGHLSGEVPSFLMTQLVSSTVMLMSSSGKEEEIYSRRAETLLLLGLPLRWLSDTEDVPDYQDTTGPAEFHSGQWNSGRMIHTALSLALSSLCSFSLLWSSVSM